MTTMSTQTFTIDEVTHGCGVGVKTVKTQNQIKRKNQLKKLWVCQDEFAAVRLLLYKLLILQLDDRDAISIACDIQISDTIPGYYKRAAHSHINHDHV